jgi:hypothetical protein
MSLFDYFKKNKRKSLLQELPESFTEESKIEKNVEPVKQIRFMVQGTFVKERQQEIKKLVKQLKRKNHFILEPFKGLTNKEIKEGYFDEKIYEYNGCSLPKGYLEDDEDYPHDPNAVKVYLSNLKGRRLHIGYVPNDLSLEIKNLKSQYITCVTPSIRKGKYKMTTYDNKTDKYKIRTHNDVYEIEISLMFLKN